MVHRFRHILNRSLHTSIYVVCRRVIRVMSDRRGRWGRVVTILRRRKRKAWVLCLVCRATRVVRRRLAICVVSDRITPHVHNWRGNTVHMGRIHRRHGPGPDSMDRRRWRPTFLVAIYPAGLREVHITETRRILIVWGLVMLRTVSVTWL